MRKNWVSKEETEIGATWIRCEKNNFSTWPELDAQKIEFRGKKLKLVINEKKQETPELGVKKK